MKAIGYRTPLPITDEDALLALDLPVPEPGPRDLRVAVRAVSVNPADVKVRATTKPEAGQARILGFDAAGVVEAVGSAVTLFRPGDLRDRDRLPVHAQHLVGWDDVDVIRLDRNLLLDLRDRDGGGSLKDRGELTVVIG